MFVLLFSMVYTPHYPQIFIFVEGAKLFFSYLVARGWEYFKFFRDLLYWGGPNFLSERGGYAIFFHKVTNDQSCKLKNSWWLNCLLHVCMLTFRTFTLEFCLSEFSVCSSVHWNSQKRVYYCKVLTQWKCEYCLMWPLKNSILFGSNSLWKRQYCVIWTLKKHFTIV